MEYVFVGIFVLLNCSDVGDVGDGGDGGNAVGGDPFDLGDHAAVDADFVPAVFADEGFFKAGIPGGDDDGVDFGGVKCVVVASPFLTGGWPSRQGLGGRVRIGRGIDPLGSGSAAG